MSRRKDEGGGAGAGGSHAGRDTIFAFTACTMRDKQLEERRSTGRVGEGRGKSKFSSAKTKSGSKHTKSNAEKEAAKRKQQQQLVIM